MIDQQKIASILGSETVDLVKENQWLRGLLREAWLHLEKKCSQYHSVCMDTYDPAIDWLRAHREEFGR